MSRLAASIPQGHFALLETQLKQALIFAIAALSIGTSFAQAPPGTVSRPSQETNPTASGGAPAAKAQMKVDEKKGTMPMAGGGAPMAAGSMPMAAGVSGGMGMGLGMGMMKSMDTNGDGMISKKEWDSHHAAMWGKMKPKMNKGMVPMADIEAMLKGGPN